MLNTGMRRIKTSTKIFNLQMKSNWIMHLLKLVTLIRRKHMQIWTESKNPLFGGLLFCLHSLSLNAVQWLLRFLGALLFVLGKYSAMIAGIAKVFPSSIFLRSKFLNERLMVPSVILKVVLFTLSYTF